MDRVNSFRGCLLKDQGFFPVSLYFRSSSKPKIPLEIRRRESIYQISISNNFPIVANCIVLHSNCTIESRGNGRFVGREFVFHGVLSCASSRIREIVSHRRGSVLARLHRVSPLSANSHSRHAARTRAWTICASVGPASIVARVRLAVFSPSNRRGSVPIRRPVGESTLQPAGQLERPLPVSAWIEATGDVVAESSPIACCVTYSA